MKYVRILQTRSGEIVDSKVSHVVDPITEALSYKALLGSSLSSKTDRASTAWELLSLGLGILGADVVDGASVDSLFLSSSSKGTNRPVSVGSHTGSSSCLGGLLHQLLYLSSSESESELRYRTSFLLIFLGTDAGTRNRTMVLKGFKSGCVLIC